MVKSNEELMDELWDNIVNNGQIMFLMGDMEKGTEEYRQAMKDMIESCSKILRVTREIKERLDEGSKG